MWNKTPIIAFIAFFALFLAEPSVAIDRVIIQYAPNHAVNTFSPDRALGAALDGQDEGEVSKMLSPYNIRRMLEAGFHTVSYRLRSELAVEAWHWNPIGKWSDPRHHQGYWTSSSDSHGFIDVCWGYRLPRRGDTFDQANNDGYSRIDDGDIDSFWKSDPYLDRYFTHESNALHPQTVVIDFGEKKPIDAIRIRWGKPWATEYSVQYWSGDDSVATVEHPIGEWCVFRHGDIHHGKGGDAFIQLTPEPIRARFIRIRMTESSHTAPGGSMDIRDRLGYAIREIYIGKIKNGTFHDLIKHSDNNQKQTVIYVSSTDPWHREKDRDKHIEQPGFDRIYHSGLTCGTPMMLPVPLLYDTPNNALAELRYLKAKGYRFGPIEMGEEPDGQYVTPEDYAALYVQWSRIIKKEFPSLKLGGPCFQTTEVEDAAWPHDIWRKPWYVRFLSYLRNHHALKNYQFFSFEWYPFDETRVDSAPQLAFEPSLLYGVITRLRKQGLSNAIPWYITEYGYSAFSGKPEVKIQGALMNADIAGQFLTLGGKRAYLYGYEPNSLIEESPGAWGNNMLIQADDAGRAKYNLATFWGAWLLTHQWAFPNGAKNKLFRANSNNLNTDGQKIVTAYPLLRPDGEWSVLLINKDPSKEHAIQLVLRNQANKCVSKPKGRWVVFSFSRYQYHWKEDGSNGHPIESHPPTQHYINHPETLTLPPYSLVVARGRF